MNGNVYREAAQAMELGIQCKAVDCGWPCCAMSTATKNNDTLFFASKRAFIEAFGAEWTGTMATTKERDNAILALCFAAAMADTGDL